MLHDGLSEPPKIVLEAFRTSIWLSMILLTQNSNKPILKVTHYGNFFNPISFFANPNLTQLMFLCRGYTHPSKTKTKWNNLLKSKRLFVIEISKNNKTEQFCVNFKAPKKKIPTLNFLLLFFTQHFFHCHRRWFLIPYNLLCEMNAKNCLKWHMREDIESKKAKFGGWIGTFFYHRWHSC